MGKDIPLGRIAGIKVSMDVTVLLVAGFYAWTLAVHSFPNSAPDLSTTTYWVAGVTFALLFFASLLVHEIGHALVARDEGIGVRGISLWLLGGVAKLESSPTTAGAEFRIAVIGPIASAACGVGFLAAAYTVPGHGTLGLAGDLLGLLGAVNLVLAGFNILPAAPLDGGTVLSAAIWRRTGSQATGMRWSAIAGLAAGSALVLFSIRYLRDGGSTVNGYSFLLVGGFVAFAALRSLRAVPLIRLLDGLTVGHAMSAAPPPAPGWATVSEFLAGLDHGSSHPAAPVIGRDGRVMGLITPRVVQAVPPEQWSSLRLSDLAFPLDRITVVGVDEPLLNAVQRVDGGDVREGLVVDPSGTVVGTVDARALFRVAEQRKAELALSPA